MNATSPRLKKGSGRKPWRDSGECKCMMSCGVLQETHFLQPPAVCPLAGHRRAPSEDGPKPHAVAEAAAFSDWRRRPPKAQLRSFVKCHPSFRMPGGSHWDFRYQCITDQMLPLPSPASLLSFTDAVLTTFPNKPPAGKFPSRSLSP